MARHGTEGWATCGRSRARQARSGAQGKARRGDLGRRGTVSRVEARYGTARKRRHGGARRVTAGQATSSTVATWHGRHGFRWMFRRGELWRAPAGADRRGMVGPRYPGHGQVGRHVGARVGCSRRGSAGYEPTAGHAPAGLGTAGRDRSGEATHGTLWRGGDGRRGAARVVSSGWASIGAGGRLGWRGEPGPGTATPGWQGRHGSSRRGVAGQHQARAAVVRQASTGRPVEARHGPAGVVRPITRGRAWRGEAGKAWLGMLRLGPAGCGRAGMGWLHGAGHDEVHPG